MNRFPVLKGLSWVLRVLGWMSVVVSVLYGVKAQVESLLTVTTLIIVVCSFVIGLILSMLGELVGVIFAIEENSYKLHRIETHSRKSAEDIRVIKDLVVERFTKKEQIES